MSTLELLWFIIIGVLFTGFFFLEGFDFGVGMSVKLLAKNRHERDALINTIGPVWDANEVWLITAGGALFASFPEWYATLFSGYYIVLFLILFGLILRGVSFEFRHHMESDRGRNFWEWATFIGSTLTPFLFGLMFTSLVRGMPIAEDKNIYASFGDYVNVFSVVGGVAVTLVCFLHGLNYIRLKTKGPIRYRAQHVAKRLYPVLFVGLVVFALLLWSNTDFFDKRPVSTLIILLAIIASAVVAAVGTYKDKELVSFLGTGGILAGIVILLFNGMFPRVMIGSADAVRDLLIVDAASTPYTLKVMTIVTAILLPIVLCYFIWSYYVFRKRINTEKIEG
ncbi:cytochrome d ubiquinol oxidase subunit II [Vagococcus intermedius]|uniref:Cytochrome d ubiquinol oxidase subunit II n=1 Tax=Vagococcus intermedius TaxID=2991418 RepID=A0AAF0I9C5_9ENTE|nr:cytochrome d ubiquinol oxidase subunit II [Vagococcus intermedius]WEG73307.1 cytochrome d ubiquinol oxidase subunit II [Vagococcus intermedius]WEG75388.1 cytochrome d ubiquinol oxidase subunit II [Vagococcus intermedius]